jgi:TonB family protein
MTSLPALLLAAVAAAAPAEEPVLATPPALVRQVPPELPPGTVFPAPEVVVVLGIDVSENGEVEAVRVEQGAGEPFDSAAATAARRFAFEPGRLASGAAVPVTITFRLRIVEPPRAPAEPPRPPAVTLAGTLLERGTRRPLADVPVAARRGDETVASATTDAEGRFLLRVPAASFELVAAPSDHQRLAVPVDAKPGEEREETFYLEPTAGEFATVVRGERIRREITSRSSLPTSWRSSPARRATPSRPRSTCRAPRARRSEAARSSCAARRRRTAPPSSTGCRSRRSTTSAACAARSRRASSSRSSSCRATSPPTSAA